MTTMSQPIKKQEDLLHSNIPDHILHHIFSFLPLQEEARTAILSKVFLSLWQSSNSIVLNYRDGILDERDAFLSHARERCLQAALPLRGFILDVYITRKREHRIDELLLFALENCTHEIQFKLGMRSSKSCVLLWPKSHTPSPIRFLTIQGFRLEIHNLLWHCPLLKDLKLSHCCLLGEKPLVSSSLLEMLELEHCATEFSDDEIDLDLPNLQHLVCLDSKKNETGIGSCRRITKLVYRNSFSENAWLEDYIRHEKLESLTLYTSHRMRPIHISNPCLRELNVLWGFEMVNIVSTPKLELLKCSDRVNLRIQRSNIDIAPASCRLLKSLVLSNVRIHNWVLLETELPKFALLKHLELHNSSWSTRNRISNEGLESLDLYDIPHNKVVEYEIDTPRLQTFKYSSEVLPRFRLTNYWSSLHATLVFKGSDKWERVVSDDIISGQLPSFGEFLMSFGGCEELTLEGNRTQMMLAHEHIKGAVLPLANVKRLRVDEYWMEFGNVRLLNHGRVLDTLLWLCPHLQVLSLIRQCVVRPFRKDLSLRVM